jgi:predicted GNAT superfamily acetyltransferase
MIKDTLYARYIFEREGIQIIENEVGFVTYKINETECFLANIYVDSSKRTNGEARSLLSKLEDIATVHNCQHITANIDLRDKNASSTMLAALKLGFKMVAANHDVLLISKSIKSGE